MNWAVRNVISNIPVLELVYEGITLHIIYMIGRAAAAGQLR